MRKVILRRNEDFKYSVNETLIDSNGNKMRAALQLNCSSRTSIVLSSNINRKARLVFIRT